MLREVLQKVAAFFGGTMHRDGSTNTVKVFSPFRIQSRTLLEVLQRPTVFFESMVFGTYTKSIDKQEMHGLQILHIQSLMSTGKGKANIFITLQPSLLK